MSELNVLIEQMVLDIGMQAYQLDGLRLRMFLNWLAAHSSGMKGYIANNVDMEIVALQGAGMQERFQSALKCWLQSLPIMSLPREYKIITTEIDWWRDLDPHRLNMIVGTDERY